MAFVAADSGPYLSHLTMQSNTYTIKDKWARDEIAEIEKAIAGGVHFRGVLASGSITDGESKKELTVVDGAGTKTIAAADQNDGDIFIYNNGTKNLEFIVSNGAYSELGSTGNLGSFAYADQGSGTITVPISSAITFNPLTPSVTKGTLAVTYQTGSTSITTTATTASGTFSPAAITIAASTVTITPTTDTFTALKNVTYDSTTATLTITDGTSEAFWKGYSSAQAAGQTVTPEANQTITVTYDKVNTASISSVTGVSLTGDISVTASTPTATITNPEITVTVTPVSS
ncbi:MAG: hypothetical protein J6Q22_10450 [Prevotella sp.]|nr:hypothetical protein [Prevotella sp.]